MLNSAFGEAYKARSIPVVKILGMGRGIHDCLLCPLDVIAVFWR